MAATYPIGVDVSFWQDANSTSQQIDWAKCKANGASFAFIRAGQNTWTDEDFITSWKAAKAAGIPRGTYWYLDNRTTGLSQAERFYNFVAATGDLGELPMVIDYEHRLYLPTENGVVNKGRMRLQLKDSLEYLKSKGREAAIYTGPDYWRLYGSADTYWSQYKLWLAHYDEDIPYVPAPWKVWSWWQYTPSGDGLAYGMESREVDLNYAAATLPLPPPVEPPTVPALPVLTITIASQGYKPITVDLLPQ